MWGNHYCQSWRSLIEFTRLGNVWHGSQEPWHNWDKLAGRFVSEFGMYVRSILALLRFMNSLTSKYREGYPNIRTVDYWLGGNKSERFPQSRCLRISFLRTYKERTLSTGLTVIITRQTVSSVVWRFVQISDYHQLRLWHVSFSCISWRTSNMPLTWRVTCTTLRSCKPKR